MKMELLKNRLAPIVGAVLVFFFVSCADKDASSLTPDETAIEDEILADADELFSVDIMGESDPTNIGKTATSDGVELAKTSTPIPQEELKGYGRRVRISRSGIAIVLAEDSMSAIATVTYKLIGKFVLATKPDTSVVLILKPMEHLMQKRIRFVRNTTPDSERRWLVDKVSMGFGISKNGTMSLGSVTITITGANDQTITTSAPLDKFFDRTSLPIIQAGDVVNVTVALTNSNASDAPIGTMHRGAKNPIRARFKQYFTDNNDGTYTYEWTVPPSDFGGVHVGVMDFFTTSTLYDTEAAYNSLVVTMPYIKGAQLTGN